MEQDLCRSTLQHLFPGPACACKSLSGFLCFSWISSSPNVGSGALANACTFLCGFPVFRISTLVQNMRDPELSNYGEYTVCVSMGARTFYCAPAWHASARFRVEVACICASACTASMLLRFLCTVLLRRLAFLFSGSYLSCSFEKNFVGFLEVTDSGGISPMSFSHESAAVVFLCLGVPFSVKKKQERAWAPLLLLCSCAAQLSCSCAL